MCPINCVAERNRRTTRSLVVVIVERKHEYSDPAPRRGRSSVHKDLVERRLSSTLLLLLRIRECGTQVAHRLDDRNGTSIVSCRQTTDLGATRPGRQRHDDHDDDNDDHDTGGGRGGQSWSSFLSLSSLSSFASVVVCVPPSRPQPQRQRRRKIRTITVTTVGDDSLYTTQDRGRQSRYPPVY